MVVALITIYNPTLDNINNVVNIATQVDKVLIWDNSISNNKKSFDFIDNATYFFNGKNEGLSKSFNNLLKNKNVEWDDQDFVIFFDQDSKIPENYIDSLVECYKSIYANDKNIGCLGPGIYNINSQMVELPRKKIETQKDVYIVQTLITSSLLTTYQNLMKIGFWNENLFLDLADQELCYRFKRYEYNCYMTSKIVLNHSIGEAYKKILFFNIRIHKPFREYYQTRDALYLIREKHVPLTKKIRYLLKIILKPIIFCFLEGKRERFIYFFNGINDYKKNVKGEYNA